MSVRLVATDLDGTVVRSDGSISERTLKALRSVASHGVQVVFVTGRPPRWLAPVLTETGIHGPAICSNGAQVIDTATGTVLIQHLLEPPLVGAIAADILDRFSKAAFGAELAAGFACEKRFAPGWDPPEDSGNMQLDELTLNPMVKLMAHCPGVDPDVLLEEARSIVGDRATVTRSIAISLVEVCRKGVDKGTALAELARSLGVRREEVLAFGDQTNDAPMLAWAGQSYAVANAHPEALEAARFTTASVDDDGVAAVLETLLAELA